MLNGPKSICVCGHTGDGAHSQHATEIKNGLVLDPGHGGCIICNCQKFMWKDFTPKMKAKLEDAKNN